jgi:NADH-quinone oxidoreductase subunit K
MTAISLMFQLSGLILLVAMIGAIVLTMRHRRDIKRQNVLNRCGRDPAKQLELRDVKPGQGVTGVFGIFVNRKNVIVILMSIELMLLAVNINFVAFSTHLGDLAGQVFTMFILTVAAAEAAIGLAILVVFFRNRGTIAVEDVNVMKG